MSKILADARPLRPLGPEKPMKYLCTIYVDEAALEATPQADLDEVMADCRRYDEKLKRSGRFIASERLQPVATATTIRRRNGRATLTDGPFAETKEQLGGFYLIEARDLNDALRIAADIPPGKYGAVEVRPIWEYT
jgi:hypothetical protein